MSKLRKNIFLIQITTSGPQQFALFWLSKSIFMPKIILIFLFFFIEQYHLRSTFYCSNFLKTSIFESLSFLKISPIFVGSEVLRSSLYQKNNFPEFIYIYILIVLGDHRDLPTTLDTLNWLVLPSAPFIADLMLLLHLICWFL